MNNQDHSVHTDHPHTHGPDCGHVAVRHGDHVDEHVIKVSAANPDGCTPKHGAEGLEAGHRHGPGCGHEAVPHGTHFDYLVVRLHHVHGHHCDDPGALAII